jgi:hypothetical protein
MSKVSSQAITVGSLNSNSVSKIQNRDHKSIIHIIFNRLNLKGTPLRSKSLKDKFLSSNIDQPGESKTKRYAKDKKYTHKYT